MVSVFIDTFGCQMNVADSKELGDALLRRGYTQASTPESARLIIVNTCSVRQKAENRALARIKEYARIKKRKQQLWVIGCMAQRLGSVLKDQIPQIDHVFGAKRLEYLIQNLDEYLGIHLESGNLLVEQTGIVSQFVSIMRGCENYCSYCIVPYVRGKECSLEVESIISRIKELVASGCREVCLLGQNVNSYFDRGCDFADLLKRISEINGLLRIRFTTSHPKDLNTKLIQTMVQTPTLCHHVHLPVQSGSNNILALMNRKYTIERYRGLIDELREAIPHIDITTDVMVGFPGESEVDFEHTLELFQQVRFTQAFMFAYSPREGTTAAALPDQITHEVKQQRLQQLVSLQVAITKQHYNEMIGKRIETLITESHQSQANTWMGLDTGCKRVIVHSEEQCTGIVMQAIVRQSTGMTLIAERVRL